MWTLHCGWQRGYAGVHLQDIAQPCTLKKRIDRQGASQHITHMSDAPSSKSCPRLEEGMCQVQS
eukprot:m.886390 g.886390  ORF g.886390 m.886390 type:complete len:64 (-) comp23625_c0_seq6:124-315(-)